MPIRKAGLVLTAVVSLLSAGTGGIFAQNAVDPASLDYVVMAVENTLAASSLHVESQLDIVAPGMPQSGDTSPQETLTADLVRTETNRDSIGVRTLSMLTPGGTANITVEWTVIADTLYLRLSGLPSSMGQLFPTGWFDATQLMQSGQPVPVPFMGISGGSVETFSDTILGALAMPISAESVTALSELNPENIDDQPMRVFQLTLDPAAVQETGPLDVNFGGPAQGVVVQGGNGALMPPPASASGGGSLSAPPLDVGDTEITLTLWIGDTDGLVHRTQMMVVTQMPSPTGTGETHRATTAMTLSGFNEPVQVTAPESGS